jgi:hypothetical protein
MELEKYDFVPTSVEKEIIEKFNSGSTQKDTI